MQKHLTEEEKKAWLQKIRKSLEDEGLLSPKK